jgi:serine/threonine protein kinase
VQCGGSSEVFAIEYDGRRAALKWLLADCARSERGRSAFEHEMALLERCQSPRLPRVLARAVIDGRPAAVLSWVDGAPLEIGQERSVGECVSIVIDVLEGLHALHQAQDELGPLDAVHRDVCPANILVNARGRATLIDLGLASSRWFERAANGLCEGTLGYHSPELFTGVPAVDRRSDVFCAAIVLWELLARRTLFPREKWAEANAIVNSDAPSLHTVRGSLPEGLASIVARALSRDCSLRPQSAREFARSLEPFVTG